MFLCERVFVLSTRQMRSETICEYIYIQQIVVVRCLDLGVWIIAIVLNFHNIK